LDAALVRRSYHTEKKGAATNYCRHRALFDYANGAHKCAV